MGLYRTILEEDEMISHLDDNNNVSMDTRELMDMIDNSEEIDDALDAEFDDSSPSYESPEDIVDESFFAIAESEMEWNNIMQQIGIKEVHNESTYNAYTEAFDGLKDWFKKAKDWIVNFFKKVMGVIKRWASNIFAMLHTNKSFADKYGSQMDKGYKIYMNNSNDVKKLKGYPFRGFGTSASGVEKAIEGLKTHADATMKGVDLMIDYASTYRNFKVKDWTYKDGWGKLNQNGKRDLQFYDDNDEFSMTDFRNACDAKLRFGDNGEEWKNHTNEEPQELEGKDAPTPEVIKSFLKDANKAKSAIKKITDYAKKQYKSALSKVDRLQKTVDKLYDKKDNTTENDKFNKEKLSLMCTKANDSLHRALNANQIERSSLLSNLHKFIAQCRRFGNYYVQLANKANPKMRGFQDKDDVYKTESTINLI